MSKHRRSACRRPIGPSASGRNQGSVTIFLCILLSVIVPLVLILTDIARLRLARSKVDEAVRLAAESILADYERPLRDQYGLLGMAPRDVAMMDAAFIALLKDNLEADTASGFADPFGLHVVSGTVALSGSLDAPDALRPQLSEYMRYRAPVALSMGFVEKLKSLTGAAKQVQCVEAEMALERIRSAAREDLVRLHLLKEQRLIRFGKEDSDALVLDTAAELIENQTERVKVATRAYQANAAVLSALLPQYKEKRQRVTLAAASVDSAKQALRQAQDAMTQAQAIWENAKTEAASEAETDEDTVEEAGAGTGTKADAGSDVAADTGSGAVTDASAEGDSEAVAQAHKAYLEASASVMLADATRSERESSLTQALGVWNSWHETSWKPVEGMAGTALAQITDGMTHMLMARRQLTGHLYRQGLYLDKAAFLATGLTGTLVEIDTQTGDARTLSESASNELSTGALAASANKIPDFPSSLEMETARDFLVGFREQVCVWEHDAMENEKQMEALLTSAMQTASAFHAMTGTPDGLLTVPSLPAAMQEASLPGTSLTHLSGLRTNLAQQLTAEGMKRAFMPGQTPSAGEVSSFWEWFTGWSGEADPRGSAGSDMPDESQREADKTMREIRKAAGVTAEAVREGAKQTQGGVLTAAMRNTLPSTGLGSQNVSEPASHPLAMEETGSRHMDETRPNSFTMGISRMAGMAVTFNQLLSQASDKLLRVLWEDAYILAAFTNGTTPAGGIPHEISWGRDLSGNVFSKGEVEYILFGQDKEETNLLTMKGALFGMRLALNLLHIHASPQKRAAALSLATTLAGWTAFGIPVVQNFLMIAWAAAESYSDVDRLLKGEAVPLIKTDANWFLSAGTLRRELVQNLLLDPLKGRVAGAAGGVVGKADDAVRETVGGWLDAAVDGAFAPLEASCADFGTQLATQMEAETCTLPDAIASEVSGFVSALPESDIKAALEGGFATSLACLASSLRVVCVKYVSGYGIMKVTSLRESVKQSLRTQVFASGFYTSLLEYARTTAMGLTNQVFEEISAEADAIFGQSVSAGGLQSGITGRMATMDYQEYLTLFLLLMPPQTKTARVADLIQLNLQAALRDETYQLNSRYTRVSVTAAVKMDFWFLPADWGADSLANVIHTSWETGY